MKLILSPDFLFKTKDKQVLCDTNVFIDALVHPVQFGTFFNQLKENNVQLTTIYAVLMEFVKGVPATKFQERIVFIEQVIGNYFLPITKEMYDSSLSLIALHKEEGRGVSITDLLLGGALMQDQNNLLLLTKNISDFPRNIFTLETFCHLLHRKAIQNYGVYSFPHS